MVNILTEIPFITTKKGPKTVREVLLSTPDGIDDSTLLSTPDLFGHSGIQTFSYLRFLTSVAAVAERYRSSDREKPLPDAQAIDRAIAELAPACELEVFMQRPPVSGQKVADPVKKLWPSMPPQTAEDFWDLGMAQPASLNIAQAASTLLITHFYSVAGNSSYAGAKCAMGAPGIRFPGKDNTATEIIWTGPSIYETLLYNLPQSWVYGGGLPAWADREAREGVTPLWEATWSSNTAACLWQGEKLEAVKLCGIPDNWYIPAQGKSKEDRKSWWDNRNQADPNYMYVENETTKNLQAVRIDLGRDATELAVLWNAHGYPRKLKEKTEQSTRVYPPGATAKICFARHLVGGTASSPVIRASEILFPASSGSEQENIWNPPASCQKTLQEAAKGILDFERYLTSIFRRPFKAENSDPEKPLILEALKDRKMDASAFFWRNIDAAFKDFANADNTDDNLLEIYKQACNAVITAFDETVAPHQGQYFTQIAHVRQFLINRCSKRFKEFEKENELV